MDPRAMAATRGTRLEYLTIGWNLLEGVVAVIAGVLAGSIALLGFGLDSAIEVFSGAVILWRLRPVRASSQKAEQLAVRLVGASFIALAAYIVYDAVDSLLRHDAPQESVPGIILAAASLIAMPLLARAKRRVARDLNSGAMQADSRQTDFCAYLSAILLAGLLLNAFLGWWWADPVAALVMVPLVTSEGAKGLRGRVCCDGPAC